MLLMAAAMLSCCSDDDNNTPQPDSVKEYPSLMSNFLETYGFRSLSTECDMSIPAAERKVMVPVEGVMQYNAANYNGPLNERGDYVLVNVGKSYTFKNNPHNFNRLLEKFGDTNCTKLPEDISIYQPHPYAITGIDMQLVEDYSDMNHMLLNGLPDYNSKYPVGGDCTSLFKIRYRTYYDYIKNGYSWEGLESNSPWKEMDLTEFNRRGGDKLIDMSCFYLIVKEAPQRDILGLGMSWTMVMKVSFENGKTNQRNRNLKMEMRVDPDMFK